MKFSWYLHYTSTVTKENMFHLFYLCQLRSFIAANFQSLRQEIKLRNKRSKFWVSPGVYSGVYVYTASVLSRLDY